MLHSNVPPFPSLECVPAAASMVPMLNRGNEMDEEAFAVRGRPDQCDHQSRLLKWMSI